MRFKERHEQLFLLAFGVLFFVALLMLPKHLTLSDWISERWGELKHGFWIAVENKPSNEATTKLPVFELRVKPTYLRKLEERIPSQDDPTYLRAHPLQESAEYIDAAFWFDDVKRNVKVRYRGDNYFHWGKKKKSWRVKFKGNELFYNQRRINLISPKFPSQVENLLGYRYARELGLIAPRSHFVHMRLNGSYLGAMLFVEQIDKHFLINHELGEGKLYAYDEGGIWYSPEFWERPGAVFRVQKETPDVELERFLSLFGRASDDEFWSNLKDLIDYEAFLEWHAYCTLLAQTHQDAVHNQKFFFDPSQGRFLPIVWDPLLGPADRKERKDHTQIAFAPNQFFARLIKNPEYFLERNRRVWRMLKEDLPIKKQLEIFDSSVQRIKDDIHSDRLKEYTYTGYSGNHPLTNERWRKAVLDRRSFLVRRAKYLDAVFRDFRFTGEWVPFKNAHDSGATIDFAQLSASGSQVLELVVEGRNVPKSSRWMLFEDVNRDGMLDGQDRRIPLETKSADRGKIVFNPEERILPSLEEGPRWQGNNFHGVPRFALGPSDRKWILLAPKGANPTIEKVHIALRNLITEESSGLVSIPEKDGLELVVKTMPKVQLESNQEIRWSGKIVLKEDFVSSMGTTLKIEPGTTVRLGPKVSIFHRGTVEAQGKQDQPIRFEPIQPGQKAWGTLAVFPVEKGTKSVFRHVQFRGGSEGQYRFAKFTGMLAVHHADVDISNALFEANDGEDAVNFKYSQVRFRDSVFKNVASDGFDCDFCRGEIWGLRFDTSMNDGMDVSYSKLHISDLDIRHAGDKGISVGERSDLTAKKIYLEGNKMGIAVKDESSLQVEDVSFVSNEEPFAIYRKKNEFSHAGCLGIEGVDRFQGERASNISSEGQVYFGRDIPMEWLIESPPKAFREEPCKLESSYQWPKEVQEWVASN